MTGGRVGPIAAALLALAACGGDADETTLAGPDTAAAVAPPVPTIPDRLGPGLGRIVFGTEDVDLTVEDCQTEPTPADDGVTELVFSADAAGEASDGRTLIVEARRFRSTAEGEVVTDTITIVDPATETGLRAQRFETDGEVTDLRDPSASAMLLAFDDDEASARGLFGPVDARAGDARLVGGALQLSCP